MKLYRYQDIVLTPEYSNLESRREASTAVTLGPYAFKLPIIPANMRAVINEEIAEQLANDLYFYIMHRFDIDIYKFVEKANRDDWHTISISVGVNAEDKRILKKIKNKGLGVDYLTIDIAHGHSSKMVSMIEYVRELFGDTVYLIAGNVATEKGVCDLYRWGADCVKVGIGQGHACTTKDKTGFTMPMFSCALDCARARAFDQDLPLKGQKIPIIADGGIHCNGDIAKSLVAGAKMAMAGSIFSRCLDSPAETVLLPGGRKGKKYYGSASAINKGHNNNIEGTVKVIESNHMTYMEKLHEIEQDLQSAISYAGGNELSSLPLVTYKPVK
jgi:GMP reductase